MTKEDTKQIIRDITRPVPTCARRVTVYTVWEAHWEKHRCAPACCAPGCGDKIKPGDDETCFEITWSDGSVSHLEEGCVEWFIDGHPDYGHGYGAVPGITDSTTIPEFRNGKTKENQSDR